ncbi:MAG: MBL fold metallo-hydrolase [Acidimicrobiales bacterium]
MNRLPINVFVIEHADGLVLFDAGQDWRCGVEPDYWPGGAIGVFYRRINRFHVSREDDLADRLAAVGYRIEDVQKVALSHLHYDHVGYLRELTHADIYVTPEELAILRKRAPSVHGVLRQEVDLPGLKWRTIEFAPTADPELAPFTSAFDVAGDGSLVVLPTPGHTPGSSSLLVRRSAARAPLLLIGDLAYTLGTMRAGHVPGVGKRRALEEATRNVVGLKERWPGLAILPTHDPGTAARLEAATTSAP